MRRVVEPDRAFQEVADGEATPLDEDEARRLRRLTLVDEAFLARFALAGELAVEGVQEAGPGEVATDLPAAAGRAVQIRADEGVRYGLVLPGIEIPPDDGEDHRHRCLEALALLDHQATDDARES